MQQLVTATSFMVLTNVNKFIVIFFGVIVLKDEITAIAGVGVALAMGGGLWYGRARSRMQEFTATASSATEKVDKEENEDLLKPDEESVRGSSGAARRS